MEDPRIVIRDRKETYNGLYRSKHLLDRRKSMGKDKEQQQRNKCRENSEQSDRRLSDITIETERGKRTGENEDQQKNDQKQPGGK